MACQSDQLQQSSESEGSLPTLPRAHIKYTSNVLSSAKKRPIVLKIGRKFGHNWRLSAPWSTGSALGGGTGRLLTSLPQAPSSGEGRQGRLLLTLASPCNPPTLHLVAQHKLSLPRCLCTVQPCPDRLHFTMQQVSKVCQRKVLALKVACKAFVGQLSKFSLGCTV